MLILKSSKNQKGSKKFIEFCLSEEAQNEDTPDNWMLSVNKNVRLPIPLPKHRRSKNPHTFFRIIAEHQTNGFAAGQGRIEVKRIAKQAVNPGLLLIVAILVLIFYVPDGFMLIKGLIGTDGRFTSRTYAISSRSPISWATLGLPFCSP